MCLFIVLQCPAPWVRHLRNCPHSVASGAKFRGGSSPFGEVLDPCTYHHCLARCTYLSMNILLHPSSPHYFPTPLSHFLPPRIFKFSSPKFRSRLRGALIFDDNAAPVQAPAPFLGGRVRGRTCAGSAPDGWLSPPLSHFFVLEAAFV